MGILVNKQHEAFCVAYFGGMNGKEAAVKAAYSPKTARSMASRLLTKVNIITRLQELQEAAVNAKIMSVIERKERLSEIARARLSDFVECGQDGSWINIGLDSVNSAALQEIKSKTEYDDDGSHPTVVTNIRLRDPIVAIQELNKMEGTYPPTKQEVTGKDGKPIEIETRRETVIVELTRLIESRRGGEVPAGDDPRRIGTGEVQLAGELCEAKPTSTTG